MKPMTDDEVKAKREEVSRWLNFPFFIANLEEERDNFSRKYYQEHSFYSHTVYTEHFGIVTEAPRVDEIAVNLADAQATMDNVIKRNKEQYRLFKEVLSYLPRDRLKSLETQYLASESYVDLTNEEEILFKAILLIKRITESDNAQIRFQLQKQLKERMEQMKWQTKNTTL